MHQVDRDLGLCASCILQEDAWIVGDAKTDVRALANPLVAGKPESSSILGYRSVPRTGSTSAHFAFSIPCRAYRTREDVAHSHGSGSRGYGRARAAVVRKARLGGFSRRASDTRAARGPHQRVVARAGASHQELARRGAVDRAAYCSCGCQGQGVCGCARRPH